MIPRLEQRKTKWKWQQQPTSFYRWGTPSGRKRKLNGISLTKEKSMVFPVFVCFPLKYCISLLPTSSKRCLTGPYCHWLSPMVVTFHWWSPMVVTIHWWSLMVITIHWWSLMVADVFIISFFVNLFTQLHFSPIYLMTSEILAISLSFFLFSTWISNQIMKENNFDEWTSEGICEGLDLWILSYLMNKWRKKWYGLMMHRCRFCLSKPWMNEQMNKWMNDWRLQKRRLKIGVYVNIRKNSSYHECAL